MPKAAGLQEHSELPACWKGGNSDRLEMVGWGFCPKRWVNTKPVAHTQFQITQTWEPIGDISPKITPCDSFFKCLQTGLGKVLGGTVLT